MTSLDRKKYFLWLILFSIVVVLLMLISARLLVDQYTTRNGESSSLSAEQNLSSLEARVGQLNEGLERLLLVQDRFDVNQKRMSEQLKVIEGKIIASEALMTQPDDGADQSELVIDSTQAEFEREHEQEMERLQVMDQMLDDKYSDPEWLSTSLKNIDALLYEESFAELSLISQECGSDVCRLEIAYADFEAEARLGDFARRLSWAKNSSMFRGDGIATFYIEK